MDYQKHYDRLIDRARYRIIEGYTERHHIIPKCMGGTNIPENIVKLTPEEHFVAHQLLIKIFPEEMKLAFAAHMMCKSPHNHRSNNKMYGWLRRRVMLACSQAQRKKRKKETAPRKKRIITEEHKRNISEGLRGRVHSEETKRKIKETNIRTWASKMKREQFT